MHIGRFRLTVRRLMIGIALVALLAGAESMRRRRAYCLQVLQSLSNNELMLRNDDPESRASRSIASRYLKHGKPMGTDEALAEIARVKPGYERAASRPWLPIPTDPE
jgi:hypothetical protein